MAKKRAPGGGRKAKAPETKQSVVVAFKVTPAERVKIGERADKAKLSLSDWLRMRALK